MSIRINPDLLPGLLAAIQQNEQNMNTVTVLTRAISIGTEGANGTLSPGDRQAIAGEVQGLTTQLLGLANTQYQGTYIFSGTAVTTQPFTLNAATNTVAYNGNANTTSVA